MNKVSNIKKSTSNMGFTKKQSNSMGFTLIELMIVVAMIAILATIAYPSFIDSVRKGRRADAQTGLMEAALKLENFYARNATYTDDLSKVGYANAGWNDISGGSDTGLIPDRVNPGGCNIANCFVLETQSQGDQVNDSVSTFTLRSTGAKTMVDKGVTKNGWK